MSSFEEAFEAAPVGMLLLSGDGKIAAANRYVERILGYSRGELLGRAATALIEGVDIAKPDAGRESAAAPPGVPSAANGRHRDGRQIPVEVELTLMTAGDAGGLLVSVADLSERRRAEEQFRLSFEALPNGMMLVNERGIIMTVNAQIEQIFGYPRTELVGKNIDTLLPERYRAGHGASRDSFFANPTTRPMGLGRELFGLRRDGREVPVEIGLSPLRTRDGNFVLSSIVDITERTQAKAALQSSLHEKEVLLKELHHRAKNNLQLIASLLDLAAASPSPDILAQCRERVQSIGLVHERLYQSGTFARINVADYLQALVEQMAQSWARPGVTLTAEAPDEFTLPLDAAIPCGLVVNELIINAFKHAFPDEREGAIVVRARRDGARVTLEVSDNGVGMDAARSRKPGHIGLDLLHALTRQLRGEISFHHEDGTCVRLTFEEVER